MQQESRRKQFGARGKRLLVYFLILLGVAAWKYVPRPWKPSLTIETAHYSIASTATREQTEEIGRVVEILYLSYSNQFGSLPTFQVQHPKLKLRLYKDRGEMRRVNPSLGWAEAYYRKPYCRAYYSAGESNPYHWMLHEAVHQLNEEVAHLNLSKWLEEGIADYFATSRIHGQQLALGEIDPNTYPVWWIDTIATAPDLKTNLANGSVIPLRSIISNSGGPSLSREFNLYYLHWWTLTHFIFEDERHRHAGIALMQRGGGTEAFEQLIGPIDSIQVEWHRHVQRMKAAMEGKDPEFLRRHRSPGDSKAISENGGQ
jgi:hypothetical protein